MAMSRTEIETMIREAFPDARVEVKDLAGDGNHYAANVVTAAFKGKSKVQQHQMVYAALKGKMGGDLHALALTTSEGSEPSPDGRRGGNRAPLLSRGSAARWSGSSRRDRNPPA